MRILNVMIAPLLCCIPVGSLVAQTIDLNDVGYGPFDYTNPEHVRDKLPVVEQYHFNRDIENLTASIDDNPIGAHLVYVIRSFPNHHRALRSITKLWSRNPSPTRPPPGIAPDQTPDMLFGRAIDFAPTDGTVRLLYGMFLLDAGRDAEAIVQFDQAGILTPESADINYNLGLMYLRVNDHEKADFHASRAYEQGHPLPGLRRKMIAAGIWSE